MSLTIWAVLAVIGLIITVAALALMAPSAKTVGTPSTVALQNAGTAHEVEMLKGRWGDARLTAARANLGWDFLLILGYTSLFAGLAGLTIPTVSAVLGIDESWLRLAAIAIPVAAGASDVMENVISLVQLSTTATDRLAKATCVFARLKWTLILITATWLALIALPIGTVRA